MNDEINCSSVCLCLNADEVMYNLKLVCPPCVARAVGTDILLGYHSEEGWTAAIHLITGHYGYEVEVRMPAGLLLQLLPA